MCKFFVNPEKNCKEEDGLSVSKTGHGRLLSERVQMTFSNIYDTYMHLVHIVIYPITRYK